MFYDTHAHILMTSRQMAEGHAGLLSDLFSREGIKEFPFILDIGTEGGDLKSRREFFGKEIPENIFFTAGIWPSRAAIENQDREINKLLEDIKKYKIIGIGEAGFDRRENNTANGGNLSEEKRLFLRQIEIAKAENLPVIVHSRDAYEETYETIAESGYSKGIIHCFSYGLKEALSFVELGFYISFSGIITYKKNENIREAVKKIPRERILLETDSPYLSPQLFRGKTNTPVYITETYKKAAEILDLSLENMCLLVKENTQRLFNLS